MNIDRYDHRRYRSHSEYQKLWINDQERDLRLTFLLNSIFTDLAYRFHQEVHSLNEKSLRIPELSGFPIVFEKVDLTHDSVTVSGIELRVGESQANSRQYPADLHLRIPTSPNHQRYSVAMINAGRALYTLTDTISTACEQVDNTYKDLLVAETFLATSQETIKAGIQSVMQTISMLTYEPPEYYIGDPVGLTKEIINRELLDVFAMCIPLGFLGREIIFNRYFANAFSDEKPLKYSAHFKKFVTREKAKKANSEVYPGKRNQGCPGAYKNTQILDTENQPITIHKSGIQLIAELFPPYLDYFYSQQKV